ncbi:BCCT family transporter [Bacteriovorax sp. Seq25_V]|uniref:BCCT family transporter n=1 Tax=Bacteriovorax sp. Seq25_V TaxID=1201288 RepID=UPI000389D9E6|nr:BCCT family transporter [Bacteriovorax sp. Seq25_V]EQC48015.1 transporter, betaine/carnitine/choline family [Bacteriovorax sp. Seq25_V]
MEDHNEKTQLLNKLEKAEKKARKRAIQDREPFKGLQIKPTSSLFNDSPAQEPGESNWTGYGFDIHPQVTFIASALLVVFITLCLMFQTESKEFFAEVLKVISVKSGWFFILSSNIMVIACLFFAFSRFGSIRIGGIKAKPEFSRKAWYAMLLSAGMGIGLMFWSVGEPISHLQAPSPMFNSLAPGSAEAAQAAMAVTFFHWGLHPWSIYALVGLGLAFFSFNRGLPLTIRSIFYPLLGERIYGFWGNVIDVLSVLATLAGLATSLGFGVQQVNAGLNKLFDVEISVTVQVILICIITGFATLSVASGLDKGVKYLSGINMGLAAIFMLFLLVVGPTVFILGGFTQSIGFYIQKLPQLSLWTETFKDTNWQGGWTVFYWAWWISWSPFVGMFIARISKGRTVREFIIGVILIPSLLSFIWMSVFGGTAIFSELNHHGNISAAVKDNVATALFVLLEDYPLSGLLSFIAIILVSVFFVTSSDSGSLVVDHLTSGGKLDSPIPQRIFWAVMEGILAVTLLLGGGLTTLQTAAICTGLPFALILLVSIYSIYIGLSQEYHIEEVVEEKLKEVEYEHMLEETIKSLT